MPEFYKSLGHELLAIARGSVKAAFSNKNLRLRKEVRSRLSSSPGIFINVYRKGELRGSFGYPPGTMPLSDSVKRAARGAAFQDVRFRSLKESEFNNAKFEVVLFSGMKEIKAANPGSYFRRINPRKHGLLVRYGPFRAMNLPQFASSRGFSARDYLEKTIEKAGLAPEMWQSPNLRVFTFTTKRFSE